MNLLPPKLATSIFVLLIPLFAASCTYDTSGLSVISEICDNGIDDDGDGLIDCDDPDCIDHEACLVEICDNGIDDDGDGHIDCDDQDCFDSDHCQIPEICDNNIDDDGDGLIDCDDPDCIDHEACLVEICDNNIDDDGDGLIDCDDPDCVNHQACLVEICDNGIDDDNDGLIDCDDPDCEEAVNCLPEICNNQIDDNNDGKIDCLDPQCFDRGRENSYEYCGRCNPYNHEGCSESSTCYVSKDHNFRTFCFSSTGTGQHHDSCNQPNDCAPGLFCTVSYTSPICVPICYPDVDESCPDGHSCYNFSYWGNGPSDWGVCWSF